jgi:CRP-like cAMP-binding protein
VNVDKEWVPPLWYYSSGSNDLYTSGNVRQYAISLYISILIFGGNEIGGTNEIELAFTGMAMLFSAIINALIFGEMAVLVEAISRKETEFQEKIDTSNTAMQNLKLPIQLQDEVRDFLIFTQGTLEQQEEMAKFFKMISSSLKVEVSQQIFYSVAKDNEIIKNIVKAQVDEYSKKLFGHSIAEKEKALFEKERTVITSIVKYLKVELKNPEDIIIKQNDRTQEMYYVAKGVCTVQVVDQTKKLNNCIRNLLPGDHFGEIAMIYGTARTATVISKNYSTLAVMSVEVYHDLTTEYPTMISALKEHIYCKYDDPLTLFCKESLERVPYFQGVGNEAIYDVMFTLKKRFCEKDEIIQMVGEDADSMFLVLNGMIELYTYFEDQIFVLERLWRGSVMNFRTFFQEYESQVNSRCMTKTILLELSYEKMVGLTKSHETMEKSFLKFEKDILKEKKSYPLDYILNLPDKYFEMAGPGRHETIKLENVFKNVVMRRLYEIRELKAKPKLKDLLLQQLNTKNISDWKARIEIKKKIREMTEKKTAEQFEEEISIKFTRLITNLERTLKIITTENITLNSVETKLLEMSNRGTIYRSFKKIIKNKPANLKTERKTKVEETKIQPYERLEDADYKSDTEEAKADRIKEISKTNYGAKKVNEALDVDGEDMGEDLEFSFSSGEGTEEI